MILKTDAGKGKDLVRPVFDIPDRMMCTLVPPGTPIGRLTAQAADDLGLSCELELIATGTDKACEILGLGCVNKRRAALSFGTTATVTFTTGDYMEPESFIPPYDSILPGHYTPEIEIFRGYWLISWFKKEFAQKEVMEAIDLKVSPEEVLNKRLKEIPAGSDGLVLQPYFTPNLTMPEAKGAVIGLSDVHTRIHLYRAIIEGINFALMDGCAIWKSGAVLSLKKSASAAGAPKAAKYVRLRQICSAFRSSEPRRMRFRASAVPSRPLWSLGVFKNYREALTAMVHKKDIFKPDRRQHEIYQRLYEDVYKQIYPKLAGIYEKMSDL